ncbi:3-phosphoshikimate 1-carboxyvinyltransferase [Acholeplasma equirhinis]|nr:3-phosphoshikimate 1-carboxyvinyltransferase [Acholeplasma equirhinis]MBN3490832.1 3-phosphoshikimate 1-carboxyvinyltransferase [Acholeplasma equirhinis]
MLKITPNKLTGTVHVVSSKSLSHRYVIAASLAEGVSNINNVLDSDDLVATKAAVMALGAKVEGSKVTGSKVKRVHDLIDCHESGSTLRFFIPIAMLQNEEVTFTGRGKLPERPQNVYEDIFKDKYLFSHPESSYLPLTVSGPLKSGNYEMSGNVSSQFVTGLLYALPLVEGDSKIVLTSPLESKGYVDLTLDVIKQFGIHIESNDDGFFIPGNQKYLPHDATVEGDYSGAAFFVVAGLLGSKILLKNLREDSLQGDKAILDFCIKMGGDIQFTKEGLLVNPSNTKGITIDLGQTPDLGPILMVLGALSEGDTLITNASRLRIKESDRLAAMVENLTKMGVKMDVYEDSVRIYGQKTLKGNVTLHTFGDHRIAMACAVASIKADGPITLDDEKVVSKSYPTFFEVFKSLGGILND